MALRVGFHTTLLKIGKFRFGARYTVKGLPGIFMVCTFAIFNLMWYMIVGSLWLMYGFIWLFFVLPIKGIRSLVKKKKQNSIDIKQE